MSLYAAMINKSDLLLSEATAPDFQNTLICGVSGVGKTHLAEEFLRRRFGDEAVEWREYVLADLDDKIMYSSAAYRIDLRINRRNLVAIIQTLSSSRNVATGTHQVFLIRHFEELGLQAQGSHRRIIERTKDTARFIVLNTGGVNRIIAPIQSRFQIITLIGDDRLPDHIADLYRRFKVAKYLPDLLVPFLWEELDSFILNQPWTRILEVREMLYATLERGYDLKLLMEEYVKHIMLGETPKSLLIRNNIEPQLSVILSKVSAADSLDFEKVIYMMEYILVLIKQCGRFK